MSTATTQAQAQVAGVGSVPLYVVRALDKALEVERGIDTLLGKRGAQAEVLHGVLTRWEQHANATRTQLNQALYVRMGVKHDGTPAERTEYMRVAQVLSRAWRFGRSSETSEPQQLREVKPIRLPRPVRHDITTFSKMLQRQHWTVAKVTQRSHAVLIELRPMEDADEDANHSTARGE